MMELYNIHKSFYSKKMKTKQCVLKNISFQIGEHQTVGLMGESGSGKSTLARILLKLIAPDEGSIFFDEKEITNIRGRKRKNFRKSVQLISQQPESFFDPSMKIKKSLAEPLKIFGIYEKNNFEDACQQWLYDMKLDGALLSRYPHQLSGGEIQRLCLLRALLLEPRLLVLDECTAMLDISVQAQILHLLKAIQKKKDISYFLISHEKEVVNFMADEILVLKNGELQKG